ncbi:MAG: ATP-binding cassette domain-containing protein [Bacilli bacterium]
MAIELKEIEKKYDNKIIFENLNMKFEKGKLTVVYGKSGCGKTTLLNIVGLLEKTTKGRILYDGVVIDSKKKIEKILRERVGFVLQNFGLIDNFTVFENFMIINRVKKMKNNRIEIDNILKKLNLENCIDQKVYELSGGEQQRISIAKLMLKNPDIILADEPTASLDAENKIIILNEFKKLLNEGKTIIVVSHDAEIIDLADIKINLMDFCKSK